MASLLRWTKSTNRRVLLLVQGMEVWMDEEEAETIRSRYLAKLERAGNLLAPARYAYATMPIGEFMCLMGKKLDQLALTMAMEGRSPQ